MKDFTYPCGRQIRIGDRVQMDGFTGVIEAIPEDSDWWSDPDTPIGIYVRTTAEALIRTDPDLVFRATDPDCP